MDLSFSAYERCELCPRRCGVDRTAGGAGVCGETDQLILDLAWKPRSVQAFDLYGKGIKAPALRRGLQRATIPVGGYLIIR